MAKTTAFKAYDLQRRKLHTIPSSPANISQHRVPAGSWTAKTGWIQKTRTKVTTSTKASKQETRRDGAERVECNSRCYRQFRKEHFVPELFDIRGPGPVGYGAYTKPGVTIKGGQYLDEYLGELKPLGQAKDSLYTFEIPGACVVDAEKAGNWTRFVNSHCTPNVKAWGDFIGKRHVVLFQALRDIGPEEELFINYGNYYFENAGFKCTCNAENKPHMPGGAKPKRVRYGRK